MVEYILGNYLVKTGKITEKQFAGVLEKQETVRVKLGVIAVSEGMMTTEQADEVNRLQAVMDKRFGDIAVGKGYLTDEQISKLLRQQGNTYLMFVQTLVDENLITLEELENIVNDFKKANGFSNTDIENIKSDDVDRIVPIFMHDEAKDYVELAQTVVRSLIRIIDTHIYIGKAEMINELPEKLYAAQKMEGTDGLFDMLLESDGGLTYVSSVFGQEEFDGFKDDAVDAAGELLNCINGLYVSNLSRNGMFLELMPPEYGSTEAKVTAICRLPLYVNEKQFYFLMAKLA